MTLGEVKDIVREQVGRDKIAEPMLDWCLQRGLRAIEQRDNFYWMEASQLFEIAEATQAYSVRYAIAVEDMKDIEHLLISDRTAESPEWVELSGPVAISEAKPNYTEDAEGCPAFWSLREEGDDPVIMLWPPSPDQDYRGNLHYYKWTALPTSAVSNEHEVLRRWPEALIYLATAQGILLATKDQEQAMFWELQFHNPANPTVNTEYKRIKLFQENRKASKKFRNLPSSGQSTLSNRLRQAQKAWF
jgi:hypothetical protein